MKNPSEQFKLFKNKAHVFLINTSEVAIKYLVYCTFSTQYVDDDNIICSSKPFFRIEDIPARSYLELEKIDPYEDGAIHYIIEKIAWANGLIDENIKIHASQLYELKRSGTIDLNALPIIRREKIIVM